MNLYEDCEEAEKKILSYDDERQAGERTLSNVALVAFSKPKLKELVAFLHVRLYHCSAVKKSDKKIPVKKGKLKSNQNERGVEDGERNLILVAFENRHLPHLLPRPDIDDEGTPFLQEELDEADPSSTNPSETNPEPIVPPIRILDSNSHIRVFKHPREFLSDCAWVCQAKRNLSGVIPPEGDIVEEKIKVQADKLYELLVRRHRKQVGELPDEKRRSYCFSFVQTNLSRFAALLCLFGQAADEPSTVPLTNSLLKHPLRGGEVRVSK